MANHHNADTGEHCAHCLAPITPTTRLLVPQESGPNLLFCCPGCRGIYQFIHHEGLDAFYRQRQGWQSGAPEENQIEMAGFEKALRAQDNGEVQLTLQIGGIRCASCIWLLEKGLTRLPGVSHCLVNYGNHRARLRWHPEQLGLTTLLETIQAFGYTPRPAHDQSAEQATRRDLLMRFGTAGFLAMQLMLYSVALYAGFFQDMSAATRNVIQIFSGLVATPVILYSGRPFLLGAYQGLRHGHANMDLLICLGAGAAYFFSLYQTFHNGEVYYDTAVMIITFILLGRLLESGAKQRASEVINRLAALSPNQARLLSDQPESTSGAASPSLNRQNESLVAADQVQIGQKILILPGERIPRDGRVCQGGSEVDEAMLTGEAKPVSKTIHSRVFAGTINCHGNLVVEIDCPVEDTALSKIIQAVEEAQARRPKIQALADTLVTYFVPIVLLLAGAAALTGTFYHNGEEGMLRAVAILIVACPCALGLATPLAVLVGSAVGADRGMLFKGGDILEKVREINHVVLDKTGTLTTGQPTLQTIFPLHPAWNQQRALQYAASLETGSEHVLSHAFLAACPLSDRLTVEQFKAHPGQGISGQISGLSYRLGNLVFMETAEERLNHDHNLQQDPSATLVYLSVNQTVVAAFSIGDTLRPEATAMVAALHRSGCKVSLLSGDHIAAVAAMGAAVGIEDCRGEYLPTAKADYIEQLRQQGARVAMVGDGINDGPALSIADVGIGVAKATDIALESADLVLMRDDLNMIPESLLLARQTFQTIKQNLAWACGYNLLVLPAAFLGLLNPIMCAGAMACSSLCVVGNSLRLHHRYQKKNL